MELTTDKNAANPNTIHQHYQQPANQSCGIELPELPHPHIIIINNMEYLEQSLQSAQDTVAHSPRVVTGMAASDAEEKIVAPAETIIEKTQEDKPKKSHRDDKFKVTFRTHLTSLAHVSVVVFVYLILKLAFRGDFVFFTWHPILMSVGWMLMMTEGFYAINKYNTYWRMKTTGNFRVKIHVTVLATGYTLAVIGFIIVYLNKENLGKHHFVSWHGLFGLIGLVCTFPPVINGVLLWYKKELANYIHRPKLLKFIHVTSGTLAFTFGALALVLSVYTKWYGKKSNHSDSVFYLGLITVSYPLFWAVYGPSVKLARVIKQYISGDKED